MMTRAEDDEYRYSSETLRALQTFLLSVEGVQSFLQEVAELAAQILTASCGITTEHDGHPLTVASSDYRAKELDESQYAAGEGTCLYAMRSREVVDVPDIFSETRWPAYIARAREQGLRSRWGGRGIPDAASAFAEQQHETARGRGHADHQHHR